MTTIVTPGPVAVLPRGVGPGPAAAAQPDVTSPTPGNLPANTVPIPRPMARPDAPARRRPEDELRVSESDALWWFG